MSGHTPGPWRQGRGDIANEVVLAEDDSGLVADCYSRTRGHDERVANARLTAAAPETAAERDRLREVNAELLEALDVLVNGPDHPDLHEDEDWARWRDLVAKAKGEQP